ncbi:LysR family transcriptional regulator [Castellaniella sp.]|uniref:LysR family transcriptional regulator n=1 Tax=Castellaniella sp. TaxID=1955812 RepID=UPI00356482AB
MSKFHDWTDFQFFLTVARVGTVSKASLRLGVEHSTVSRRIDRLETLVGAVLFDRSKKGYALTDAGRSLVGHVEAMESALHEAMESTVARSRYVMGTVRVGTPEAFGVCVLAPQLERLHAVQRKLHIELIAQPQYPSLVTREVDVIVTLDPPKSGRYTITRLAEIDYFVYGSPTYLNHHPSIKTIGDLDAHAFVDYVHDGTMSDRFLVLEEIISQPQIIMTSSSILAQRAAAVAGMGLVLLTPYVADVADDLVCVLPGQPLATRKLWLAAPNDLFKTKRVRLVWDFILSIITDESRKFRR